MLASRDRMLRTSDIVTGVVLISAAVVIPEAQIAGHSPGVFLLGVEFTVAFVTDQALLQLVRRPGCKI